MTESPDPSAPVAVEEAAQPEAKRGWGEWIIAVGLLGLGITVLTDGLTQRASTSASGIGAGFMPTIIGTLLIVLAVILAIQLSRGRTGEPEQAEGDVDMTHTQWIPLLVTVAALIFFVFAVEPLGYVLTTIISMWVISWAMGARKWWTSLIIAVVVSLVIYFSFTLLLTIHLPAGVLEGII